MCSVLQFTMPLPACLFGVRGAVSAVCQGSASAPRRESPAAALLAGACEGLGALADASAYGKDAAATVQKAERLQQHSQPSASSVDREAPSEPATLGPSLAALGSATPKPVLGLESVGGKRKAKAAPEAPAAGKHAKTPAPEGGAPEAPGSEGPAHGPFGHAPPGTPWAPQGPVKEGVKSYTIRSSSGARIEVHRTFFYVKKFARTPPDGQCPSVSFQKFGGIDKAWAYASELAGWGTGAEAAAAAGA